MKDQDETTEPKPDAPVWAMATYKEHKCACKVIGNGTLPNPLTIQYCSTHAAAPEILEELEDVYKTLTSIFGAMITIEGATAKLVQDLCVSQALTVKKAIALGKGGVK
jgi:hypothetical protein